MSLRVSLDSIKGTYTGCVTSEEVRRYNGMVFDKEEAPCIFVKKFAYLCRYQDLMLRFGQKAVSQLTMISNQVQNIIYEN